ncbi:MAG: L-aspartate oxidase [Acidobacteria bacterium]|nr:MAG: L-aspartate oxidase [Acidobacteriota bacterium]
MSDKSEHVDYLILGAGIAGLRAAIELADSAHVLILTKGEIYESSTEHAQGGIAAALAEDDEVYLHLQDTLQAGDGLCREDAVKILVEQGPHEIKKLIDWGMEFDREGTKLAFTREGAHSRSRVLHAHGDSTGAQILRALMAKVKPLPTIKIRPHTFVTDLLLDRTKVAGVNYIDAKSSRLRTIEAGAVVLATGGLGQVYKETTNPDVACGDGVAIAYRSGALLSDMEFVQFHPTALYAKGAPRFLLSEALRGEGGILRNIDLHRFMPHYHDACELAPRDIVSRAIVMEMRKTGTEFVYLDLTGLKEDHVKNRFPRIYATCLQYGLDITTDLLPVRPAAHYAMGGVATDLNGKTSLEGLYAAGEVAATGVHGANRLASNSLLEGLVFGARAGASARRHSCHSDSKTEAAKPNASEPKTGLHAKLHSSPPPADISQIVKQLREILWDKVGIIREQAALSAAVLRLGELSIPEPVPFDRPCQEARNMLTVARLIAGSSLARRESRGAHYRTDMPFKDDSTPPRHSFVRKDSPVSFDQNLPAGFSGKSATSHQ